MKRWAAFAAVLALAAAVAACAEAGAADITEILVTGPDVVDITATSATVLAETDVDVVCSVVYGTTKGYGQLATDDDMAGGGHRDHHPILTGLKPDTTYHLTFRGIGPDGTMYRYKDISFRTMPEDPDATPRPSGDNVALLSSGARVVGTSSNFGGAENSATWGGGQAIDGDASTQWSSDGDGDDAWIELELELELADETVVTALGLWTRTMGSSAQISSFQVITDQGETAGPFRLDDAAGVEYFETALTTSRLRFEVIESSGGNTGAVEIEVYGSPAR